MYKEMLGTRASIAIIIHSCSFFSFHVFPFHPCWVRFVRSGLWPCVWGVAGVCTPNTNTEVTLPFRSSRTNHFRAPEPTIPEVLAVFPTQRFHQPRSAAPPPTPTIANYKPFHFVPQFQGNFLWLFTSAIDLNPKPKTLCTISGRMTLFENHLEGLALKVSVSVVLQWRVAGIYYNKKVAYSL